MKKGIGVLIAIVVLCGALAGVAYYQNKVADNGGVLLLAQAAVLQSPVCRSTHPGERVACQINTYLVQRRIGSQSIHFNMHRAPGNEEMTVDVTCARRYFVAGRYVCRATPGSLPAAPK